MAAKRPLARHQWSRSIASASPFPRKTVAVGDRFAVPSSTATFSHRAFIRPRIWPPHRIELSSASIPKVVRTITQCRAAGDIANVKKSLFTHAGDSRDNRALAMPVFFLSTSLANSQTCNPCGSFAGYARKVSGFFTSGLIHAGELVDL